MKTLSALFFGMGIGYMNQEEMLFLIPFAIGGFFLIIDMIYEKKSKEESE